MNLNETIICYKKIAEANRDSYVCLLETSYQNQMQNKAIMDRHKRKAEDYEQLAEWLLELKVYKDSERLHKRGFEGGYTKAIEDFTEALYRKIADSNLNQYKDSVVEMIDDVAEQLKAGGVDA